MGPVAVAALPPAIAGVGSLIGGALGNRARAKEAEKNRQFQERMRNTQWQAAVSDMEAAGINPALAYSQGPAASPGGSMANQMDVLSPAISSAMQARRMHADVKLIEQQVKKAEWDAETSKQRLMAYGIERTPTGKFRIRMPGPNEPMPRMVRELEASINRTQQQALREGHTAATLKPLAELAEKMGIFLPMLGLISQMNPGGILKGAGSLRAKPAANVTKNIKNFWRR